MGRQYKIVLCNNSDKCPHARASLPINGPHRESTLKACLKATEMALDEPEGSPGRATRLKWLYALTDYVRRSRL